MSSRATGAAVLLVAGLVGGCTSSVTTNGNGSALSSTTDTTTSAPPSGSTTTSPPSVSSSTSSAPSSPPSAASSSSSAPNGPASCTATQLSITLARGGAFQHSQYAGLIFTNRSASTCSLTGYPFAQLRLSGAPLGNPATHEAGTTAAPVLLHAGQSAQSQLTATTDCNAPLSDMVRVSAPGQTATTDVADTLRQCTLTVGPVEPAS